MREGLQPIAEALAELGRDLYGRGWTLATSGNFSAVVSRQPLELAITGTGLDKGRLTPADIVLIDAEGCLLEGSRPSSAEARLHVAIVEATGAGAVLHTHSVWGTVFSERCAAAGGLVIQGYEMLKAFAGVSTHEHREWVPVLANSQDIESLAASVRKTVTQQDNLHALLIRRHGLYTWGRDLPEARRHVEAIEFLLEVLGRTGEDRRASSLAQTAGKEN